MHHCRSTLIRALSLMRNEGELIARFGDARLIKHLDGKLELLGGSPEDRAAARKWLSQFPPDATITERSRDIS